MSFLGRIFGGDKRNARLAAWGKTVPVSEAQHAAMQKVWQAIQSKSRPHGNPLEQLRSDDLAYVLEICGSAYRPAEFGNSDLMRLALFQESGLSDTEAAVAVGMMFNFVGRDDV